MQTDFSLPVERAAILGVGLMGGSLGMAWKRSGVVREVVGIGRDLAKLNRARELGAVDRISLDLAEGLAGAQVVVLAAPIGTICNWAETLAPHLSPGAVVTDVGSTKDQVVRVWEKQLPPTCSFVGAHPMCGSEHAGVEAARPDLYQGAPFILTPGPGACAGAVELVAALGRAAGAVVLTMPPHLHDQRVAYVSHLPQLVAVALGAAVADGQERLGGVLQLAAGGFKDTTRIAQSPPGMWQEIFDSNREAILTALGHFRVWLQRLEVAVAAGDAETIERAFLRAAAARRKAGQGLQAGDDEA